MRIELEHDLRAREGRKLLLDLREVPVLRQAVGLGALGPLDVKVLFLYFLAGAADAAEGIHDDVILRNHAGLEQRCERHDRTRRVATRRGRELDLGFPLRVGQLGQHEPRLRQQFRRMVRAIVFFVGGEIGDPEISAEIHDLPAGGHEGLGEIGGGAMRQGQEPQVHIMARGNRGGIGIDELQLLRGGTAQSGNDLGHGLARVLP